MGMKTKAAFVYAAVFILALGSLCSCGSGGDAISSAIGTGSSDSINAVLTTADAEEIGSILVQAAGLYEPLNVGGLPEIPDVLSLLSVKRTQSPLQGLLGVVQSVLSPIEVKTPSAVIPHHESCSEGSIDMLITPLYEKISIEPTGYDADITFNSCKIGTGTLGGKMRVILDGKTNDPKQLAIIVSPENQIAFGDPVQGYDLQLRNVTLVFNEFTTYQGKKIPQAVKVTGILTGTLFGENLNLACENFIIKHNPDPNGASISLAGRVKPLCVNGWVTLETPTQVSIPTGSDCPVNGTIIVKAGSNTIAVSFAQYTSVTSQFNNTVVKWYPNCKGVAGLCKA